MRNYFGRRKRAHVFRKQRNHRQSGQVQEPLHLIGIANAIINRLSGQGEDNCENHGRDQRYRENLLRQCFANFSCWG